MVYSQSTKNLLGGYDMQEPLRVQVHRPPTDLGINQFHAGPPPHIKYIKLGVLSGGTAQNRDLHSSPSSWATKTLQIIDRSQRLISVISVSAAPEWTGGGQWRVFCLTGDE